VRVAPEGPLTHPRESSLSTLIPESHESQGGGAARERSRGVDLAFDSLDQATLIAEGAMAPSPDAALEEVGAEAFLAAVRLDPRAIRSRLDRLILGADPEAGLDALLSSGALRAIFPEVYAMVGFGDGEWRHKDVWKHTKQVVRQAVPRLEVRWAALFHDIGKVKTRSISPEGKVHFLGHAEVGTRIFEKFDRRTPLFGHEPVLKSTVRFLILHHLRANQYDPGWTDSAVRRFARELGEHLDDLLCLARADITTKRPEKRRKGLGQVSELSLRIQKLAEEDARVPPLPSGIGDAIVKRFALPPSPKIGEIKRELEKAVAVGEIEAQQDLETYMTFIEANRSRFAV
jgi:poly(A) polymerase